MFNLNEAHLHLVVNHFPIILPIVGVIVLLAGIFSKSEAVKRVAYSAFMLAAVFSIIAMQSGEGAEEVVEGLAINADVYMENHEEAAELFSILSYILGAISIIGLWSSFTQKTFDKVVTGTVLIFAFVTLFFAQRTGTTGGEIRHSEIRQGTNQQVSGVEKKSETKEKDHDD